MSDKSTDTYLANRSKVGNLCRAGRFDEANAMVLDWIKRSERYSTHQLYAFVDHYAIARFSNRLAPALADVFSPRFIRHARLEDIFDGDIGSVNDAFEAEMMRVGFQGNPRPHLGIAADEKLLIGDHGFDRAREPLATLLPVFDRFIKGYLRDLPSLGFPTHLIEPDYRYRLFAAATKSDGYHPPHLHSKAGFVMVYYIRVHEGGDATLQFGTHNMLVIKPFHEVVPREGDLFIFPSFFMHGSTPTKFDKLRINLGIELEPAGLSQPKE